MRGHIREYRPGKWSYIIDVGKIDGKRKQVEKGGFASKKDADSALAKRIVELTETGEIFIPSEKTFEECFNEFIDVMRFEWSMATLKAKTSTYRNHIKDVLGYRYIKSIKTADINNLLKVKLDAHYGGSLVDEIKKTISGTMKYSINQHYIKNNPCVNTIVPKITKPQVIPFTPTEVKKMLDIYKGTPMHDFITIAIYTGMRTSEILGLRWQDVNLTDGTINVRSQLLKEDDVLHLCEPKHGSSRTISIPTILTDYLAEMKQKQDENRSVGYVYYTRYIKVYNHLINKSENVPDFVLTKDNGDVLSRTYISTIARKCKTYGIDAHPHKLRHTYATNLLELGCNIKMLQENLGHKSAMITLDIYSHFTKKHETDIINQLPAF